MKNPSHRYPTRLAAVVGMGALALAAATGTAGAAVSGTATITAFENTITADVSATTNLTGSTLSCEMEAVDQRTNDVFTSERIDDGWPGDDDPAMGSLQGTLTLADLPDGRYDVKVKCWDVLDSETIAQRQVTLPPDADLTSSIDLFFEFFFGSIAS